MRDVTPGRECPGVKVKKIVSPILLQAILL